MSATLARRASIVGVVIGLAALTACAKDEPAAKDAGTGPVSVQATDSSCDLSRRDVKSGTSTFSVSNSGSKVTEFYVYADGDRVMGEVENIGPGLKRDLIVELPTGHWPMFSAARGLTEVLVEAGRAVPTAGRGR